jgi:hypothetical protein
MTAKCGSGGLILTSGFLTAAAATRTFVFLAINLVGIRTFVVRGIVVLGAFPTSSFALERVVCLFAVGDRLARVASLVSLSLQPSYLHCCQD